MLYMNGISNRVKFFLCTLGVVLLVAGCQGGNKNISRATGWKINSKEGGFQYNTNYKAQKAGPGLVFVEGGTFTMGKTQDDVMHDWNNIPTQQHVQSFYMDETEVTNKMYVEYLDWLKRVFPPDQEQYKNIYEGALPDTLVWRNPLGQSETMVNNYLRHPAYGEYPVVGVSWVQAVQFSDWRTNRVNEALLAKEGYLKDDVLYQEGPDAIFNTETYLNDPTSTYGGRISEFSGKKAVGKDGNITYAKQTSGALLPEYRLPTEAEWEYAAKANTSTREYNNLKGRKKYPWDGTSTRSSKKAIRGDQLANFKQGRGDYGGLAGWSDDKGDITVPVKTYPPNDFGLYDMAGNVAEWVADVYRPIIADDVNDFNYFRGNKYMKLAIGEDGKQVVVTPETMVYDTLSNGRIVYRSLPGGLAKVPVDSDDLYLRYNIDRSDNRNYNDGDKISSRNYSQAKGELSEEDLTNNAMYNAPKNRVYSDKGKLVRNYDKSNNRTTLIDDEVRVYKGGSWRDRAYWLDPAQRRYLPQYMATDYIGFRNAMSHVGPKAKKAKTAK